MTSTDMLRLLWAHTPGHRRSLVGGLVLLVGAALVEVASVLVMADVLTAVLGSTSLAGTARGVGAWVGATLLGALLTYGGTLATCRAAEGTVLALRDEVLARVLRLPMDQVHRLSTGDVVVRLTEDVVVLETALSVSVVQAVVAVLTTGGLVAVAWWLSWQLTLIALVAVPVLTGLARAFRGAQERATAREREAHSALGTVIAEVTGTVELARLHAMETAEAAEVHRRGAALFGARMREARVHAAFGGVLGSAQALTLIAVSVAGVALVRTGSLTYGALIALTGYLGYLYPRVQDVAESRLALVGARISAERLAELAGPLGSPARSTGVDSAVSMAAFDGARRDEAQLVRTGVPVRVTGLAARRGDFLLDCPEFSADPGVLTAVTGPSGSGKSTLAHVLAGLTSAEGTVGLGDRMGTVGPGLRELVTLVPQRAVIRTGTLASNIAYGSGADPCAAGDLAGADEFVRRLPAGYATPTSLGGEELSGGQRQRIALARGIGRPTPVLILDEPSTGLDEANTERLAGVLQSIAMRRTVIVITHDPLLRAAADRCYRVLDGQVTLEAGADV
ncbi:ABC transporter transmembrane domain-containing protein [Tsukamurella ocularis]|uniref:ABC transporter transmembrane domain-containing protein n=1 Tax=Tsukamurella ocularis TaxID=1970234 RepID=UPI00216A98FA|nr:ABC transporter ATP-binding protein [Tsukamurella ocularis]MCS3780667.1 ATP-binding cassette subfamily B protein [Tsukamurella ocularis]MCS3786491.1 ATP-binding cassette subfamily B protein [Tsukamurella ocularis]MCS3850333.1 ATP-binding cassette subfamily B protein [Tsukamurella ocularis]